jgi:hypothetical protein
MDLAQIAQVLLSNRGVQLALLKRADEYRWKLERGRAADKAERSVLQR